MRNFNYSISILIYLPFIPSYPPRFISSQFNKFFTKYLSISATLPFLNNENNFAVTHRHLLNNPANNDPQLASGIAKPTDQDSNATVHNSLVQTKLNKESNWLTSLIIHYTHENRLANYKTTIHQLWNQTFNETPATNTRLIIGNRNSKNLTKQLVRRRPEN
jgi:hypothetical protein